MFSPWPPCPQLDLHLQLPKIHKKQGRLGLATVRSRSTGSESALAAQEAGGEETSSLNKDVMMRPYRDNRMDTLNR